MIPGMAAQHPDLRIIREALEPAFEEMARWIRALHEALGGDEGIRRLTATLEQRQAERERWEAEHPGLRFGDTCHCFCQRWDHVGICTGWAETTVVMTLWGDPVRVPLCPPCATHAETRPHARERGAR